MPGYIIQFEGINRFLSNFWKCDVTFDGDTYSSSEHAYQAAKTLDKAEREMIKNTASPGAAKRMGRQVILRDDWEEVKNSIMLEILRNKFSAHKDLEEKLLETGNKVLVEGNKWHDCEWGVCYCDRCNGMGKNKLGEILMQVREERKVIWDENLKDRTHEECADCSKENVQPQPCKGHVDGPSPCLEFQLKASIAGLLDEI
jgi:ribA/ribD-fused uncharacterized protein